jgi:integrase
MGYRQFNQLTDREVRTLGTGRHGDGGGLALDVEAGAKGRDRQARLRRTWVFRFKGRTMGLGAFPDVTLAQARERAADARRQLEAGIDPIAARRVQKAAAAVAKAKAMTFDQCRDAYVAGRRETWRNPKHAAQWMSTLETYVTPVFGTLPVQAVDTGLVLKAIEPLWRDKPETASRVRNRIELVLSWAKARGYPEGENPARWRGHLDQILPRVEKARKAKRERTGRGEHHAALAYADLPAFMVELRERDGTAVKALEFVILTAARTGEVLGATWDEVDLVDKTWTVPKWRMKKGDREHRVPLSDAALAIIEDMKARRENDYVFPGNRRARLSDMALLMLLRRLKRYDLTTHGFRSTFRDWAADQTNFPGDLAEFALSHRLDDKTEAAYRRSDMLEKRRRLMTAWARYCAKPPAAGQVVPLAKVK